MLTNLFKPGNLPPWSDWNYGERELRKRSTGMEVEKELTELETRGKRGKKNKLDRPLLSIKTKNGGMVFATKSRRIDVPDAVAIDVSVFHNLMHFHRFISKIS
jgi:hypothetical protein